MDCAKFRELISPFLDKDISFSQRKRFDEHRDTCPSCQDITMKMEQAKTAMAQDVSVSLSHTFLNDLQARIQNEVQRQSGWWQRFWAIEISGFTPASISGLAVAGLATLLIGFSLIKENSAPVVNFQPLAPQKMTGQTPVPSATGNAPDVPLPGLASRTQDSTVTPRDSTVRDYSDKFRYVTQKK